MIVFKSMSLKCLRPWLWRLLIVLLLAVLAWLLWPR